jgi:hypothetical protein
MSMKNRLFALFLCVAVVMPAFFPARTHAWGESGHRIIGRAAALKLPADMPKFFRNAADQLSYLNPEPDRWRDFLESKTDPALNAAAAPEHYVDLERITETAMNAPDRYVYLAELNKSGVTAPGAGLLPFQILEIFQRMRVDFRLWRAEKDKNHRKWLEARIINDAGILGHYVADGSNPHHTTIHHNGWVGENPQGYTTDKTFHARFETKFVDAHVSINDVLPKVSSSPTPLPETRRSVWKYLRDSHERLTTLYDLEKRAKFDATTDAPEHKEFAVKRLVAGAEMLRDLWWTAWATSETPDIKPEN